MTNDEIRAAITDALADTWERWDDEGTEPEGENWAPATAAALTPTVQQLIAQAVTTARADAWETAANMLTEPMAGDFRARAAGLRGHTQATR